MAIYLVWLNRELGNNKAGYIKTAWTYLRDDNGWQLWRVETNDPQIEQRLERDRCVMGYEPQGRGAA